VDKSTDVTYTAQLAILVCGVDSNLCVTEEILDFKSMHGTNIGKDSFHNVCQNVADMNLPWDKLIGLTTDGAPAMYGEKNGLVGRIRTRMLKENCPYELTAYHFITYQGSLCVKGLRMEHVMTTVMQIINFIQSFLWDIDSELADIPYHTEVLWLSRGKVLSRVFELSKDICQFMEGKGKDSTVLQDKE